MDLIMAEEEMSESEIAERLASLVGTTPSAEEKQNVHTFLYNVATAKDTTKTGYLDTEELGIPTLPLRTYKELALFCNEIANMGYYGDYFFKKGEILTATSLSKEAKLLMAAISTLQKREIADVTKPKKANKGWFKPKQSGNVEGVE
mgnify:CR=1 FL=1|tara:strand:- start:827 stop:1267 length:441 start_codon:yes stop_codon:yes gene_type:complete